MVDTSCTGYTEMQEGSAEEDKARGDLHGHTLPGLWLRELPGARQTPLPTGATVTP